MKGISIILCCYNSSTRLPETLQNLAKQKLTNDISVEIILVNNASTDNTKEVSLYEWNKYATRFSLRIVDELKPGLIFARECGVKEAKYEYIIFCDDDNWLKPDYCQTAFELMENNPQIGALGGQGTAVSDVDFPEWFSDFEDSYAVGKQAEKSGNISDRAYVWGAGLITRKSLMVKAFDKNFPFLLMGRKENILLAGDDSEVCKRILLLGYNLFYNEKLHYQHYIPVNRLTWSYKKNMFLGFRNSIPILNKYDIILTEIKLKKITQIKKIILLSLKAIKQLLFKWRITEQLKLNLAIKFSILTKQNFLKDIEYRNIVAFYIYNYKND